MRGKNAEGMAKFHLIGLILGTSAFNAYGLPKKPCLQLQDKG
jgi:hypothetical protein